MNEELYAGGGVDDNFSIVARRALAGGSGRGISALESIGWECTVINGYRMWGGCYYPLFE